MTRRGAGEGGIKIPREAGGEDGRGRKHARKEEHESGMAVAVGQARRARAWGRNDRDRWWFWTVHAPPGPRVGVGPPVSTARRPSRARGVVSGVRSAQHATRPPTPPAPRSARPRRGCPTAIAGGRAVGVTWLLFRPFLGLFGCRGPKVSCVVGASRCMVQRTEPA